MRYNPNDYDYFDDDDEEIIDDEDEGGDEDDEETGTSRSRVNPFTGGYGASSRPPAGGTSGQSLGPNRVTGAGTGSSGGSGLASRLPGSVGSSRPSAPSSGGSSSGSSSPSSASRFGGSSSPSSASGASGTPRYGGSSAPSSGISGGSGASSPSSASRFGGSTSGSSYGGSGSSGSSGSSASGTPRYGGSSAPQSGSSGGSGASRFGSPSSGGASPSASASSAARPSAPPSSKPDDKKADDKKAESGGGIGSRLGGFTSRFSGGGKPEEKKPAGASSATASKPADSKTSGGALGSLTSRFGGGSKPDEKKPVDKKTADSGSGGLTSRLGGLTSRFGGGSKPEEKKPTSSPTASASSAASRPASSTTSSPFGSSKPPASSSPAAASGSRFGSMGGGTAASAQAATAKPAAKPADKKAESGGLGRFLPFLGGQAAKPAAPTKARPSKAPKVESDDWLTLDRKLDILGVALVLSALMLFFSALSSTKGQLTEAINNGLSQAFGWGALAIPGAMLVVGVWLIARHFGEQAPVVPTTRVIGVVMSFIGLLLLLQIIESFNYTGDRRVSSLADLRFQMRMSWEVFGAGGGYVGAQLYDFLVTNIGEVGAFFSVVGWLIVGLMFTFSLSAAEIAVIFMSVGRSFGTAVQRRQQRRAAAAAAKLSPDQLIGAATSSAVTVSKPEPEALPAAPVTPALPPLTPATAEAGIPVGGAERNIVFGGRVRGETLPVETMPPAPMPGAMAAAAPASPSASARPPQPAPSTAGGSLTSRLRGSLPLPGSKPAAAEPPAGSAPAQPAEASAAPAKADEKPATTGSRLMGMFGRKTDDKPAAAPAAPAAKPDDKPAASVMPAATIAASATPASTASVSAPAAPPASKSPVMPTTSAAPAAPIKPEEKPTNETPARLGDLLKPTPNATSRLEERPAAPRAPGESPFKPPTPASAAPSRPAFDIDDEDDIDLDDEDDEEAARLASLPPAQPKGTGPLPRLDENRSRFAPTTFGAPRKPDDQPAASAAPGSSSPADRQDRLNALRQGMNEPARRPEDLIGAAPADKPAASAAPSSSSPATPAPAAKADEKPAAPVGAKPEDKPAAPNAKPAEPSAATPTSKPAQPAPAFWKPGSDASKPAEPPKVMGPAKNDEVKPPAPTYGRPTTPPGAAMPPVTPATAPTSAAKPAPVINTPPPAEPVPARAGVGPTAPVSATRRRKEWKLPNTSNLLMQGSEGDFDRAELLRRAKIIEDTLNSFGAPGKVVEVNTGPVITQFGVEPDYLVTRGGKKNRVKVSAIAQLDKDIQLALGAKSIRIEAPVPGKGYVGIEVPNEVASLVSLRDVMESREFKRIDSPLTIALGQSVDGTPVAADLSSMPHLLIAGTTGSGKSVCVNAIITSIIVRNPPDRVKFIMVDPKRVELTGYNGIPHLVAPVVVDLERIVGVLKWVTREMDERYKRFSNAGARNIEDFNNHIAETDEPMPYIVVIIDELADLMMLAPDETERVITRIAALARATGIHLVIATQRPSVDVVTGLIKANFPARIAFAVAGGVDSRVILDQPGAERLLGRGDMLYMSGDSPAPLRLQGVYVSDNEIGNITRFWKAQITAEEAAAKPISALVLDNTIADSARTGATGSSEGSSSRPQMQQAFWDKDERPSSTVSTGLGSGSDDDDDADGEDELYEEAVEMVKRLNKASVSLLQRRLRIGYTRAARLIDKMEEEGIVGPATEGSKPREVLVNGP